LATLDNAQKIELDVWNEFLRARWQSGSAPMDRAVIKSTSGTIRVDIDGESRSYRGSLELTLDGDVERPGLVIINEVSMSDYVSSVLPSEYGFTEPEGMKAQAIVIRTYALRARSERKGAYHLTDDTGSQVYMGISAETELARAAVEATSGMTVTHGGQLIEAVYSAHCGGHSANNEDIWRSRPVSYLRGREDPYDGDAPVARWTSTVKKNDLLDHFSRKYGSSVKDIVVAERGSGGRATMIMLDAKGQDVNITAQSFRVAVNDRFGPSAIKSTFFDIEEKGDTYAFSGRGLGHGVGLCQWGAAAQARKGRSYRDILSFYYNDVEIEGYESDFQVTSAPLADAGLVRPDAESAARVAPPQQVKPKQTRQSAAKQAPKPRRWTPSDHAESTSPGKLSGRRAGW
jgi:stage II sporulation protein D